MAALYDAENAWADDDEFFLALVNRSPRSRVVDLGCGTGRLTTALARAGHHVTGVDPNPGFLAAARAKPGGERVSWMQGTAADLPARAFDAALMTSHVAQVFVSDEEWASVLADIERALESGGLVSFDSRHPEARAWESWTREATHGTVRLGDGTVVEGWMDVVSVDDGLVTFEWDNRFPDGSSLHGTSSLRFRSERELRDTLVRAGFRVEAVYGGWAGEPAGTGAGELVVVAHA
jgi:SAM-dependent methyltransferase